MTIVLGVSVSEDRAEEVLGEIASAVEELVDEESLELRCKIDYEIHNEKLIDTSLRDEAMSE